MGRKKIPTRSAGRIGKEIGDLIGYVPTKRRKFDVPTPGGKSAPTPKPKRKPRRVSKRDKYLGRTPGKSSRTGREVIERMHKEGKILGKPPKEKVLHNGEAYPLADCDMGHKRDAVDYWNKEGIHHGAKSPEVRKWMLDPDNYRLEPSSINRSRGARNGMSYDDPPAP